MDGNPLVENSGGPAAPAWKAPARAPDAGTTNAALVPPVVLSPQTADQPRVGGSRTVVALRPPVAPSPPGQVGKAMPVLGGSGLLAPGAVPPGLGASGLVQAPAAPAVPAGELPGGAFFPAGGLSRPKADPLRVTPSEEALVGRVLDQRYKIEEPIGFGGMGVVFKGRHVIIDKPLAIKLLRNEHASQADVVKRFLLEAQLASRVKHANIVDISDYGQIPNGTAYYVMEYLTGETLAHRIDHGGRLDPTLAIDIALQILQGLQAAHASKIIHRDLKSDNIFLCEASGPEATPQVKILDFGIARIRDKKTRLTANGALIGTPAYMSPEQAQGQEADERSDLYAFGVILFEMLAGRVPFKLPTVAMVLSAQIFDTPPALRDVEPNVADVPNIERFIRTLLAKNKDERPRSAADAIALLKAAAELDTAPDSPLAKSRRPTVTIGSGGVAENGEARPGAIAGVAPNTAPPAAASPDNVDTMPDAPGPRVVTPSGRIERRPSVIVQRDAGVERIAPPIRPMTSEHTPRGRITGMMPAPRATSGPPTLLIIAAAASIGAAITVTLYKQYYRRPPAPIVAPVPAAPTVVNLIFESDPPGAQVLRDGSELLGTAPFVYEVEPQSPSRNYVFRLPGHEDTRTTVAPGKSNERIRVVMRPLVSAKPPGPAAETTPPPTEPAAKVEAGAKVPTPPAARSEGTKAKPPKTTKTTKPPAQQPGQPEQKPPPPDADDSDMGELKNPFPRK